jgi:hypothetical protein
MKTIDGKVPMKAIDCKVTMKAIDYKGNCRLQMIST